MDVGKIQGPSGGIGRETNRTQGVDQARTDARKIDPDVAQISSSGRETLDAVEALTEKARQGGDRQTLVADAQRRLEAGELDNPAVYRAVAERLLGGE